MEVLKNHKFPSAFQTSGEGPLFRAAEFFNSTGYFSFPTLSILLATPLTVR
jgi:hypothetical protein